jgi:hypothetical protein
LRTTEVEPQSTDEYSCTLTVSHGYTPLLIANTPGCSAAVQLSTARGSTKRFWQFVQVASQLLSNQTYCVRWSQRTFQYVPLKRLQLLQTSVAKPWKLFPEHWPLKSTWSVHRPAPPHVHLRDTIGGSTEGTVPGGIATFVRLSTMEHWPEVWTYCWQSAPVTPQYVSLQLVCTTWSCPVPFEGRYWFGNVGAAPH